jgi:hypothetical protein
MVLCQSVEIKNDQKMSKKTIKISQKMNKILQNQKMRTPNESGG